MFIILLTYKKPLDEIEHHLAAHIAFLDTYYQSGHFICSGRRHPRTGGIILTNATSHSEVMNIIQEDPFNQHQLADYEVIEFTPTKYAPPFQPFIDRI